MSEMKVEDKQANRGENPARFQRTDQWRDRTQSITLLSPLQRPVYSWLEALDLDEVIKSKDISDWLAANPEVNEELGSRHSRYHLMHCIKKCRMKILKKRNGGLQKPSESAPLSVEHPNVPKLAATITSNPLPNVPEDSDLYHVKRLEALRKYEILVEFEKQLSSIVAKQNTAQES